MQMKISFNLNIQRAGQNLWLDCGWVRRISAKASIARRSPETSPILISFQIKSKSGRVDQSRFNSCLKTLQSFQCQLTYFDLLLKMVEKSMIDAEKRNSETDALLRQQIITKIWPNNHTNLSIFSGKIYLILNIFLKYLVSPPQTNNQTKLTK